MELIKIEERMKEHKDYNGKNVIDRQVRYELGRYNVTYDSSDYTDDGFIVEDISIRAKDFEDEYLPEIYWENHYRNGMFVHEGFTIQTTSYGALNALEMSKMMDAYNHAMVAVKVLADFFEK